MRILYFLLFLSFGFLRSQTVVFRYDSSGNQEYRGLDPSVRQSDVKPKVKPVEMREVPKELPVEEPKTVELKDHKFNDQLFWSTIRLYPVPVKDVLKISWTEGSDDMIASVSLYEHNRVNYVYQKKNTLGLNREVDIDMRRMYKGVYIVSFQLKDGRVISKSIIKE